MGEIYSKIKKLGYSDWKKVFNKHLAWSKENKRTIGKPVWREEDMTLNVIGIRCNSETDFNYGKYNDYLILVLNKSSDDFTKVIMEVTVDPCRNNDGIAHLRQGMWNSYVVRPHKWAYRNFPHIGRQQRWAICQDKDQVEIVRTDGNGSVIKSVRGFFGINIHDTGGYKDSSLGCTVIKSDESYEDLYLPCIYDIDEDDYVPSNHTNLTYCLINEQQFGKYV
jgi:hypothetical protein